jgi:hypothetical protein
MSRIRVKGGVLFGALVSGALVAGALGGVPTARATCVSFFGLGNGGQCNSVVGTIAIALGANASATALSGPFSAALSIGTGAGAIAYGPLTTAVAIGNFSSAEAQGLGSTALDFGDHTFADALSSSPNQPGLDLAVNLSPGNPTPNSTAVEAFGTGNVAVNFGGVGTTTGGHALLAQGQFNNAFALFGTNNVVDSLGSPTNPGGNTALAIGGSNSIVQASSGPLAIAVGFLPNHVTILRTTTGININNTLTTPGAAGIRPAAKPAAGTRPHGKL